MNKKIKLPVFVVLLSLIGCSNPEETNPAYVFNRRIDTLEMENFKIPDSINTDLVIATYYNSEYKTQTLFVYSDLAKTTAQKIDYLPDSTATVDKLEVLKLNEFRSNRYNVDYVVLENTVDIIHVRDRGQEKMPNSQSFRRTDRD